MNALQPGITIDSYVKTLPLAHPEFREAVITFKPNIFPNKRPDWRDASMTIDLIDQEGVPEIHFFGPVRRWTEAHIRDWDRLKRDVFFHGIDMDALFEQAIVDLLM